MAELERKEEVGTACIVGASDGKFVLPLAERGWHVTALDIDPIALYGGKVEFPAGVYTKSPGLSGRVSESNVEHLVEIIQRDLYEFEPSHQFDVIFTSCSWHYSRNHHRPVREYINNMQVCVSFGGIFCAEYMMPVEAKHFDSEHYFHEGQIRQYFPLSKWEILEEFYTPPFREHAHVGKLTDHVHRMGFFMARDMSPSVTP